MNKHLLIHNPGITERGDSENCRSISRFLGQYFGISTSLTAPISGKNNDDTVRELSSEGHDVYLYRSNKDLVDFAKSRDANYALWVHSGIYHGHWIPNIPNLVYSVFNNFEPYGDKYNYVSHWLWREAIRRKNTRSAEIIESDYLDTLSPYRVDFGMKTGWVPHAVRAQEGDGDWLRSRLGISKDAFVIGRIGGFEEFSDIAAQMAVKELVDKHELFFVFVNTRPFYIHPRIFYLPKIKRIEKWDFYAACDLLLNGRLMGESFGFGIIEALSLGKPILAPSKERNLLMDKNHIGILEPLNLLYRNSDELVRKVILIRASEIKVNELIHAAKDYSDENVARKFVEEFAL